MSQREANQCGGPNQAFQVIQDEREKGGQQERERLPYVNWKCTNNALLIPLPSSVYELPFFFLPFGLFSDGCCCFYFGDQSFQAP